MNYYAYRDTIFDEKQVKNIKFDDWDYVYYNPYIIKFPKDRFIIMNFELNQLELLEKENNYMYKSIKIIRDDIFVNAIFDTFIESGEFNELIVQ